MRQRGGKHLRRHCLFASELIRPSHRRAQERLGCARFRWASRQVQRFSQGPRERSRVNQVVRLLGNLFSSLCKGVLRLLFFKLPGGVSWNEMSFQPFQDILVQIFKCLFINIIFQVYRYPLPVRYIKALHSECSPCPASTLSYLTLPLENPPDEDFRKKTSWSPKPVILLMIS